MLQIAVEDPAHLLDLVETVDRAAEDSAAARDRIAVDLHDDARERPDSELVRAVDAAARSGEGPRVLGDLGARVARLELTWDDVLDVRTPAVDADVATARAQLVAEGLARLAHVELRVALDDDQDD